MDFQFTEEQLAIAEAATGIFEGMVDADRVQAIEASDDRFDSELWQALAAADLLGLGTPESLGGIGGGLVEIGQVLAAQARVVAPVPLHATLVTGVLPIATYGSDELRSAWLPKVAAGEVILTAALADVAVSPTLRPNVIATPEGEGWRLDGVASVVPWAHLANAAVIPARTAEGEVLIALVPLDHPTITLDRAITTNRQIHPNVTFQGPTVDGDSILAAPNAGAEALDRILAWAQTGLALLQIGVGEAALEQTAAHLNERTQFGRTLSSFQGTMLRMADAGIDLETVRVTAWQASWRLDEQMPFNEVVLVAKWQASEKGQRLVHATQHLHGGTGADIGYPIHRYFLWGKQIEVELGSPSLELARLGELIATRPEEVLAR